jgi:general secretion pathway protein E
MKIRYRIDGVLQNQPVPPELNRFQAAILSRLKIMARLNIAEKRVPQDGRIKLRVQGRELIFAFRSFRCCMAKASSCEFSTKTR